MRRLVPFVALLLTAGCANNHPGRRVETPVNVTHEVAFGDYRRVFNTTYHILNRYGVVQNSSYRNGEITALIREDTQLFDKTRHTIQARIFDAGDFYEVECRVTMAVEQSEVASFGDQYLPRYDWRTVSSDSQLEVRLNNEIRAALSGGAWQAKEPLVPEGVSPPPATAPLPSPRGKAKVSKASDTDEVALHGKLENVGADAFERLGVLHLQRGAYRSAEKAFRAALEATNETPFTRFLLAQSLFAQGRFGPATDELRAGAEQNAEWAGAQIDVRDLCAEGFDERLSELSREAAANEDLTFLLGYMRLFSGDSAGALSALTQTEDPLATSYREVARERVDAAHGLEDF